MRDPLKPVAEAAQTLAGVITGPGTPESVKVVSQDDGLSSVIKALSGPAISLLLVANIAILTWGIKFGIWTDRSETMRAQVVGIVAIVLAAALGLVVWVAHVGRPSRLEIGAGPASIKISQGDGDAK